MFAGSSAPYTARTSRTIALLHSRPLSSKASMTTTTFPVGEPFNWERGSRMSFFHCATRFVVSLNEWLLVVTSTRSGHKRRSRSAKSCAMIGKSFIWSCSCCLTRLKQKHDPSMPRFWACRAIVCAMADFPLLACPYSQKIRSVAASVLLIQSTISFKISILVPSRHFFALFSPTLSARAKQFKVRSS